MASTPITEPARASMRGRTTRAIDRDGVFIVPTATYLKMLSDGAPAKSDALARLARERDARASR